MNVDIIRKDGSTDIYIGIDRVEVIEINGKTVHRIHYDNGRYLDDENVESYEEKNTQRWTPDKA